MDERTPPITKKSMECRKKSRVKEEIYIIVTTYSSIKKKPGIFERHKKKGRFWVCDTSKQ